MHESVENDGEVSALVNSSLGKLTIHTLSGLSVSFVLETEHFLSRENHDAHDNGVPKGNTVNLSPDSLSHNFSVLRSDRLGQNSFQRRHGCKGNGCEGVHHKVDPEQLSRVDRCLSEVAVSDEHGKDKREHACNLELEESLDVRVDIAAKHDSSNAVVEVVIS